MSELNSAGFPVHIGFIMDGNGRWAKKRGLERKFGHKEGAKTFRKIVSYCKELGVKYITFYAFSTENWKRPKDEVEAIMALFDQYLDEVRKHTKENIRVMFIGDKSAFDENFRNKMIALEEDSKDFDAMTLILAINYGGRDDIIYAAKQVAELVKSGSISSSQIDESLFSNLLYTKGVPDVDYIIRPSGELRLSNFLIWQAAYAEYYFTDVLWPDFDKKDLDKALDEFKNRKRRFGGV
ncbi:MAG: isoprenyl transferase [Oscillospiraceae bacterium]|nr:isoprenyl transferase [Oscillospiraceae bacterium]